MTIMQCARIGEGESERLAALLAYDVLDSDPEQAYDDLARIASEICATPIALVSLVDEGRQWFKSKVGLEAEETPREFAFCSHAILEPGELLVIPDALQDERFFDNPLVTGEPRVRFYAGAPLVNSEGHALGTLCVIDHQPRSLTEDQQSALQALARQVVCQLELRRNNLELRRAVSGLKNANEELEQLAAFTAHDLRSSVHRIIAYGAFLQEQELDQLSQDAAGDLQQICDSAQGMDQLITSMLELCGTGKGDLSDSSVALSECANLAVDSLREVIQEKSAQICIDELPFVRGDMTLLTQLFKNLIENALKFQSDAPPRVHLACILEDGELLVIIGDNGISMNSAQAKKAFTPFQRSHEDQLIQGSGIGLAIVKKIVECHGGQIQVESKPGEGTHFSFTLAGMRMPRQPQCVKSQLETPIAFEGLYG